MNQSSRPVKTRFAPSPTGQMHFGNLRTALFNYLYASHNQGKFLLRIEDTDTARSHSDFEKAIKEDLQWLNLNWDEGPSPAEINPPSKEGQQYLQSHRKAIYEDYYQKLKDLGQVYPCFCSEEKLAFNRKQQLAQGKPPRYPGTCLKLTQEEREKKLAEGLAHTLRFHVPTTGVIEFEDLIKGPQRFEQEHIGDFIIARADGSASFMYCNAIDDALMGVSFALRGDDHLTNTPRQILILKTLNLPIPTYGHFPTILGPDSRPLSKRNGSRSIKELREEGYLPSAILNYLARLGHHYKHDSKEGTYKDEILSLEELGQKFDLKHVSLSPAHYDPIQLNNWQKLAMLKLTWQACWEKIEKDVKSFFIEIEENGAHLSKKEKIMNHLIYSPSVTEKLYSIVQEKRQAFVETVQPNLLMPTDVKPLLRSILLGLTKEKLQDDQIAKILKDSQAVFIAAIDALKHLEAKNYNAFIDEIKEKTGKKGKDLFMPLRVALTGELHGPELPKIIDLIGPEETKARFTFAAQK